MAATNDTLPASSGDSDAVAPDAVEATPSPSPLAVVFVGPPGSGKGTQAALVARATGGVAVLAGDILRGMARDGDPRAAKAKAEYLDHGLLVPDELINEEIIKAATTADARRQGFLIDGFPIRVTQAEELRDSLERTGMPLRLVVSMKFDDATVTDRVAGRYSCTACSMTYHDTLRRPASPHTCDMCGARDSFSHRKDDARARTLMKMRLGLFREQTVPVLAWYQEHGPPVVEVDAMSSVEEVTAQVLAAIREHCGVTGAEAGAGGAASADAAGAGAATAARDAPDAKSDDR